MTLDCGRIEIGLSLWYLGVGGVLDGSSLTVATSGRLCANPQIAMNKNTSTAGKCTARWVTDELLGPKKQHPSQNRS
jgi:hypothetical protein